MHPGQEVVCIDDEFSRGLLKEGKVYTVVATRSLFCNCNPEGTYYLDIGLRHPKILPLQCSICKKRPGEETNIIWAVTHRFAPIDSLSDNITNYNEVANAEPFALPTATPQSR